MTPPPTLLAADGGTLSSIESAINGAFEPITTAVAAVVFYAVPLGGADVPIVVLWLLAAAVIFTVTFKLLQVSMIADAN